MNRSTVKGIVLAVALSIGAPAAWATNFDPNATASVSNTAQAPANAEEPHSAIDAKPEPSLPVNTDAPVDALTSSVANWVVYLTLGLAILALVIGIGLSIFIFFAYRSLADYVNRNDEGMDSHSSKLKTLEGRIQDLQGMLPQIRSMLVTQRDARAPQSAHGSDWANASSQARVPPPPPEPQHASPSEVADLLDAYRLVLSAKGPDQLATFKAEYQPQTLSVTADHIGEARDGDDNVWMITKPHWGGEGIVLPGSHAIRAWGTTFQPSSGRAAQNQFGPIYTVLPGNDLEIEEPARVKRRTNGDFVLTSKGTLRGA